MTKKLLMTAQFLAIGIWVGAQSIDRSHLSTSGGESAGNSLTLEWTLGEFATATQTTDKLLLTEGFIQPTIRVFEMSERLPHKQNGPFSKDLEFNLWPSPVADYLNIQVKGESAEKISFSLYDVSGNRILSKNIDKELDKNILDLESAIPGNYVIKFTASNGHHLKSFMIIKI